MYKVEIEDCAERLFKSWCGSECASITQLPQAGSDRRYFRLKDSSGKYCAIATAGSDLTENRCFVSLARIFRQEKINVPEIYACTDDYSIYLQSDLGDESLFSILHTQEGDEMLSMAVSNLAELQSVDVQKWENAVMMPPFSIRQVMWDLNYFKYEYLKPSRIIFDENLLEDDFEQFAASLTQYPSALEGFMYRDCQSRNVMIHDRQPWWIDFQGGRRGPVVYDIVSLLWQAKAGFSPEERNHYLSIYIDELAKRRTVVVEDVRQAARQMALFRTLQVLGAYGFRGLVEHKAHFIESIPGALSNLEEFVDNGEIDAYPELKRVCSVLITDTRFIAKEKKDGLTVEVFSFSYKKGYPDDFSGNGGGFMFDCRGLHNPGRYDQYKPLTGFDTPVIEFLEGRGEIQPFLESAWRLTDPTVECYLRRGFNSLQIGFGCTGGRHRSVYSAQKTAEHIKKTYPEARVIVNHREHSIRKEIK